MFSSFSSQGDTLQLAGPSENLYKYKTTHLWAVSQTREPQRRARSDSCSNSWLNSSVALLCRDLTGHAEAVDEGESDHQGRRQSESAVNTLPRIKHERAAVIHPEREDDDGGESINFNVKSVWLVDVCSGACCMRKKEREGDHWVDCTNSCSSVGTENTTSQTRENTESEGCDFKKS